MSEPINDAGNVQKALSLNTCEVVRRAFSAALRVFLPAYMDTLLVPSHPSTHPASHPKSSAVRPMPWPPTGYGCPITCSYVLYQVSALNATPNSNRLAQPVPTHHEEHPNIQGWHRPVVQSTGLHPNAHHHTSPPTTHTQPHKA
ncbi:MAG: hypothetical protein AAFX99_33320 [Myxococcota bacterium]